MKIINKKNKYKKYIFSNKISKRLLFSSLFIIYTGVLLSINFKRENITNFISKNLSNENKQLIKESLVYQFYKSGFKLDFIRNFATSLTSHRKPLIIDINFKNYDKLIRKRKEALQKGVLLSNNNDYVNATISDENAKFKAKIRLKGDWTDHLQSKKWSYRVQIKDEKTLLGMNKFSLQSPGTRNYLSEWIFLNLLKEEGIPSLRYSFRPLIINGDYMGIYAIEEHFDKILLESNFYKEAPILKLSENLMWEVYSKNKTWQGSQIYKKSFSTGFKLNKINNNDELRKNFDIANQLLNGFHSGNLKTSEVFDIDLLARYFAITELTNTQHSSAWHNMRFYYDPFNSKLLPIGFDGSSKEGKLTNLSIDLSDSWRTKLFNDELFAKKYYENLLKVSQKSYLDNFLKKNNEDIKKNELILHKSYPAYKLNTGNFYLNQISINQKLNPIKALNVFKNEINPKEINLSFTNNQAFPIKLLSLESKKNFYKFKSSINLIPGIKSSQFPKYKQLIFENDQGFKDDEEIILKYKINGSENNFSTKLINFPRKNNINLIYSEEKIIKDLYSNKFLFIDEKNKKIIFQKGNWDISKPLIIPPGYEVLASNGLKINLKEFGMIISYSPLQFIGDENSPIEINNLSGRGGNGIAIINAKKKSLLNNVKFLNIDNIENERIALTGSVTFYQSPVKIINCLFENSLAEDSLNVVRSDFEINNSIFNTSSSDAVDIDFSDGSINNIYISNSLNDGLDISGSNIKIQNIIISNAKDKALSVGENSKLNIEKIDIKDSYIGITTKDSSLLNVNFANINNTKIDFAGFQKKYEYSGSKTEIKVLNTSNKKINYLLSKGSTSTINSKELRANEDNQKIIQIIYQ